MNLMNKSIIQDIKENIIVLFWPETCPFCQKVCKEGICTECRERLEFLRIREPRCMQCGKQIRSMEKEYCYDCMHTHHYYEQGLSLWNHKAPVNQSIYQFKYHNQRRYGELYSQELVKNFQKEIRRWNPDVIIPVPLHRARRRKRGYNQAQILAENLGRMLCIPVDSKSLARRKKTSPQKKLGHNERKLDPIGRKKNLEHAFAPGGDPDRLPTDFRRVIIIDDIYTTGNTVDQVAKVLKTMGLQKVYFLTISIGQGY